MLNRRLSEYIFYGSLALIAFVVVGIRLVVLGNLNEQIDELDRQNISLERRITILEETVQENREVQTSHLYELYDIIPNVYSGTLLTYKTVAMLETVGIDESDDTQREVLINQEPLLDMQSEFYATLSGYFMVEVEVRFTTTDPTAITDFIDMLFNSDQLFIISSVDYTIPTSEDFVEMEIKFIALYDTLEDTFPVDEFDADADVQ